MAGEVQITVIGHPGTAFSILVRDHGDPQPPPLFAGTIGEDGHLTTTIPRCYCVVVSDGYETVLANFTEPGHPPKKTIHLERPNRQP